MCINRFSWDQCFVILFADFSYLLHRLKLNRTPLFILSLSFCLLFNGRYCNHFTTFHTTNTKTKGKVMVLFIIFSKIKFSRKIQNCETNNYERFRILFWCWSAFYSLNMFLDFLLIKFHKLVLNGYFLLENK